MTRLNTPEQRISAEMKRFFPTILLALLLAGQACLLPACAPRLPAPGQVLDLRTLPQNAGHYIPDALRNKALIPAGQQEGLAQAFLERHFSPWSEGFNVSAPGSDPFWGLKHFEERPVYGENLLPLPAAWLEDMAGQSAPERFPSLAQPAVTVTAASLRVLPTHKPVFFDPADPGEGFPFDTLQNSLLPPGTPVMAAHSSLDGDWLLVMAAHVSGWVRPWDVALVDQAFMEAFRSAGMIAFTRDNTPVTSIRGDFLVRGRVGMILPQRPDPAPPGMVSVLVPLRRADGWAVAEPALAPAPPAATWPLAATGEHFAGVLDGLVHQPYGWGGLFENRDCSALIQDVYALFGIAMPRNSRAQARAGRLVPLEGMGAVEKEKRILEQGAPLLTIVNMPGHVMLYLGPDPASGRPVVLHAIWGLRTEKPRGRSGATATPGRWVLGRTVITTLTPGAELPTLIRPQGLLVERVSGMTVVVD